jgi:hypothetical protein
VEGVTALILAAGMNANPEVTQALLDAGANPMARDASGESVLGYARQNPALRGTDVYRQLNDAAVANEREAGPPSHLPVDASTLYFQSKRDYEAGTGPYSLATGDFSNNGHADLVVANPDDGTITLLMGQGDGSFASKLEHQLVTSPIAFTVGDFDGDGNLDLGVLALTAARSHVLVVFFGNGDGSFGRDTSYPIDNRFVVASLASGDFNGDGYLDLAVARTDYNTVQVLLNNGDGSFQDGVDYITGGQTFAVATGDLDGDGNLDLVVSNIYGEGTLSVLLGSGDGSFHPPSEFAVGDFNLANPYHIVLGDLNNDGVLDLAVTIRRAGSISVMLGNGDGSFGDRVNYMTGDDPRSAVVSDLNDDGIPDLAVANTGDDTVLVLFGSGDGGFQSKTVLSAGEGVSFVDSADFDGDGRPDLAVANYVSQTVSIFLSEKAQEQVESSDEGGER